jgi:hypothetical protein
MGYRLSGITSLTATLFEHFLQAIIGFEMLQRIMIKGKIIAG